MTVEARSVSSTVVVRTRGVMISPAVRVPNSTLRSISSAVSASRVPWTAERWTREASSSELRAERSSSWGSMPRRRTSALAEPLSTRIGHLLRAVKPRMKRWVPAGRLERHGQGDVLGDHLAEQHREHGAEREPDADGDGRDPVVRHSEGLERRVDQLGDRRLRQEADGEVGHRDARPGRLRAGSTGSAGRAGRPRLRRLRRRRRDPRCRDRRSRTRTRPPRRARRWQSAPARQAGAATGSHFSLREQVKGHTVGAIRRIGTAAPHRLRCGPPVGASQGTQCRRGCAAGQPH